MGRIKGGLTNKDLAADAVGLNAGGTDHGVPRNSVLHPKFWSDISHNDLAGIDAALQG